MPDPVRCCEQLDGLPYRLFLDSAARGTRLGRYSFLTADPVCVVRSKGGAHRVPRSARPRITQVVTGDALDADQAAARAARRRPGARAAAVSGRRGRLPGLRLGSRARASAGAALRRPRAAGRGVRHLRLGAGLGPRCVASVADLHRAAGDVAGGSIASAPRRAPPPCASGCSRQAGSAAGARRSAPQRRASSLQPPPPVRAVLSRRGRLVGSAARAPLVVHARRLSRRRRPGARVHLRRRHLPGQPVAALRSAARRAAVGALPPSPDAERGAVCRVPRLSRMRRSQRVARALPARGRRGSRRDAPDQGDAPARRRPRARRARSGRR